MQTENSWTREDNSNDFLYNAGSELNGNSRWYETSFRDYDPVLGRFNQVDPLAYASSSLTPYNFAFNDPVYYNDPMGDYPPGTCCYSGGCGSGSGQYFGSGYRRIGPGSGNHWSNQYRSVEGNARVMSQGAFDRFYAIRDENGNVNEEGRLEVAQGAAQRPTQDDVDLVNNDFGWHFELNANGDVGYWDMPAYQWGARAIWVQLGQAQQGGSCCGAAFAGVAIPLGGAGAGAGVELADRVQMRALTYLARRLPVPVRKECQPDYQIKS